MSPNTMCVMPSDFKAARAPDELYIFGDPMHLSAEGHRVAAQVICKEIAEKCTIQ